MVLLCLQLMSCKSTATNFLETSVLKGFKNKMKTVVTYMDFSKAIESVNHSILIYLLISTNHKCLYTLEAFD